MGCPALRPHLSHRLPCAGAGVQASLPQLQSKHGKHGKLRLAALGCPRQPTPHPPLNWAVVGCLVAQKEVSRARGRIQLYLQVSDDPASQVAPEHAVDGSAPSASPGGGGDGAAAAAAELRAQVARRESQLQQERALLQRMKADLLESQELVVGLRAQLSVALAGWVPDGLARWG